ncbi:MFS transporter [Lactobacillus sp. ESL0679]|uniref:MFS transporter n=1 Tax=Lactobacillus sp. ESL0679 TaxID=2983209 RepID=UPI0023F6F2E4|nr:MFS transporter [Lactobacillus sp. ESL0679]MDF7683358.1 MFS transporter [Lactobacillus sp. ESL0679]
MTKKQIKYVTLALMLGNIMSGLDGTVINTAIPAIVAALHGIQFMGWIVAIFLLGMSISIPLWTKIGEKITNKLAFEISLVLFIIGSIFEGLAPNIFFFLVARLVMGIGAGGMGSLPYIIVGYIYPNIKTRTRILGYLTASFNVAAIMGPLVGGTIIDTMSWHWVFYLNVPIGIIAVILSMLYFRPITPKSTRKFDFSGALLLALGLLTFLMGIQLLGLTSNLVVTLLVAVSLIFIGGFLWREKRATNPIIPLSIFKNKALDGDFLLFAFTWGAYLAVNTYLPMWAQALLGTTALVGGVTLVPNSIVDITASQSVSFISDRVRTFTLVLIGIISIMISVGGMFLAGLQTPLQWLTFVCAFSGIGVGFIFVALQVKVQVDAGMTNMATATSTSYLIRILAQTVMSAVYGVIMNMALARGVQQHTGITMHMMNELSDAKTAKLLSARLLPTMRAIFHAGIKEIMMVSLLLLVIAFGLNFYFNWHTDMQKTFEVNK